MLGKFCLLRAVPEAATFGQKVGTESLVMIPHDLRAIVGFLRCFLRQPLPVERDAVVESVTCASNSKDPHLWALTRNYSKCPLNHALHDVLHGRDAMTRKSSFRMQFRIPGWILSPAVLEDGSDVVRSVMRLRHRNDDQQNKKTNEQTRCFLPNHQVNTKKTNLPTGRLMEAQVK